MGIVRADMSITLDGYAAGPHQRLEAPFGDIDEDRLHAWMFDHGDEHRAEVDAIVGAGAYLMGRSMFVPGTGPWDPEWRGWWGEDPPYHGPVFVLTHHERDPLPMEGGTTFHFVTDGPEAAMALAREAAGEEDISIAGGATTLNQYLALGLVDELRLHVVPRTAGVADGSRVFADVPALDFEVSHLRHSPQVTHLSLRRQSDG